jgi:hypothetical protein
MKTVAFSVPTDTIHLTEGTRENIYRVVERRNFGMVIEKIASFPRELKAA